MRLEVILC